MTSAEEAVATDSLVEGAGALGLELGRAQVDLLLRYARLLGEWGRVFNLSAIRDPAAVVSHHLLDSLAVVPRLVRWSGERCLRVLDAGSGAGLPGIPLAIARPDWSITTIDAVAKKAAFVRQAAGELGLTNLRALHGRVEASLLDEAAGFDVIISRAFSSLELFVRCTRARLGPTGIWLAMKGKVPEAEISALPADLEVFHVEQFTVPGLAAARCLVWIRTH